VLQTVMHNMVLPAKTLAVVLKSQKNIPNRAIPHHCNLVASYVQFQELKRDTSLMTKYLVITVSHQHLFTSDDFVTA